MSTNKTPNYNLHAWTEQDGVQMSEMNENFAKLDQVVKEASQSSGEDGEKIDKIEERLDVAKSSSLTLNAGLQVIQGKKNAPFNLSSTKGRTLVNLLGRNGGMESISGIISKSNFVTLSLDFTGKTGGTTGLWIALNNGITEGGAIINTFNVKSEKCYVGIANLKNISASQGAFITVPTIAASAIISDITKFVPAVIKFKATTDKSVTAEVYVRGEQSQKAFVDEFRIYEIPQEEYDALASMTNDQIAAKYPYVDSVQPVRNPYAIRYGENLLPPFYEWTKTGHTSNITDQYGLVGTLTSGGGSTDAYASYNFDVIPNQDYTLSNPVESDGFMRISTYDIAGSRIQGIFVKPGESKTIKMATTVVRMGVVLSGVTAYANDFDSGTWTLTVGTSKVFKNPMLILGTTFKPFKPREDAMLALQTELYADPISGTNADEVFERDGQYFKLKKWQKLTFDDSVAWDVQARRTGVYQVRMVAPLNAVPGIGFATKFDGKIMNNSGESVVLTGPDQFSINGVDSYLRLSIRNEDSGWGDAYTPTINEIKAYFMGWRMYDGSSGGTPYNGTGTKYWHKLSDGTSTPGAGTTSLPTTQAPNWTPYQLLYQLATPTVEPITSEGQLTLIEGSNQIEVGTGIVLREKVVPEDDAQGQFNINNAALYQKSSLLSNKARKILQVFKDFKPDNWKHYDYAVTSAGAAAQKKVNEYDKSATYTITYFMLNTSPVAPFVGSVAENEKALLADLNDIVQQGTSSLSVVERSLSEALKALQNKRNVWGPI